MPLLKRVEKHNNIDIDVILNNKKPHKRKTMYPKDWSDEGEDMPEIDIRKKKENIKNNIYYIGFIINLIY